MLRKIKTKKNKKNWNKNARSVTENKGKKIEIKCS
jgi:hypothetical protein